MTAQTVKPKQNAVIKDGIGTRLLVEAARIAVLAAGAFVVAQIVFKAEATSQSGYHEEAIKQQRESIREISTDISSLRLLPPRVERIEQRIDQHDIRSERIMEMLMQIRESIIRIESRTVDSSRTSPR